MPESYTDRTSPMLKEDHVRRGFFEPDQFAAVKRKLSTALRPVVAFAYLTGWRIASEVLPLEWRQVDWQGRTVRLDPGTTKNTEGCSTSAQDIARWEALPTNLCFEAGVRG
jgi:integrase